MKRYGEAEIKYEQNYVVHLELEMVTSRSHSKALRLLSFSKADGKSAEKRIDQKAHGRVRAAR